MKPFFLSSLTHAINSYLSMDPESLYRLQKLHGKIIRMELLPFHIILQYTFTEKGMKLLDDSSIHAETTIRGTPMQMMGVMLAKNNRQRFFAEDVMIEGNAQLGQEVIELFDEIHIDWEEHLAQIVGDVPAYHAGRAMKSIRKWLSDSESKLSQNINEYVHEEANWLPTREALNDLFNDIDTLRMDVDRAETRLAILTKNLMDDEGTP